MYVYKNGKDDLLVSGFDIVFDVIGSSPATQIKFTCPGFAVRVSNVALAKKVISLNFLK